MVTKRVGHGEGYTITDPDKALFNNFKAVCRSNDRRRILMTLTAWFDHSLPQARSILRSEWAARIGDTKRVMLIDQPKGELYEQSAGKSGATFPGKELAHRIRRLRHHSRPQRGARSAGLAPLNPC